MRLKDAIALIRIRISDIAGDAYPQMVGYSDEFITELFNDALLAAYLIRPEFFNKTVQVKLKAGNVQCFDCCDKIVSVDAEVDKHGIEKQFTRKINAQLSRIYANAPSCGTGEDVPLSYDIDDGALDKFYVTPEVKIEEARYVRLTCNKKPTMLGYSPDAEIAAFGDALWLPLAHHVLHGIYLTETESETSVNLSTAHFNLFEKYLKEEYAGRQLLRGKK